LIPHRFFEESLFNPFLVGAHQLLNFSFRRS
jgi:hypothetical protein